MYHFVHVWPVEVAIMHSLEIAILLIVKYLELGSGHVIPVATKRGSTEKSEQSGMQP